MSDETLTLRAICDGLQEQFNCLRFEEHKRKKGGVATDVFVCRNFQGFDTHKHAFLIRLEGSRLFVVPGSLLRRQLIDNELVLELADPTSIDKLISLFESCRETAISTTVVRW